MAEIEAIHAAIRRELVVLSTQAKTLDFMELSDRHVLRCARRHPIHYGVTPHKKMDWSAVVLPSPIRIPRQGSPVPSAQILAAELVHTGTGCQSGLKVIRKDVLRRALELSITH